MNKKALIVLLILITSFSSIPLVMASDPVGITAEIPNWDDIHTCYAKKRYYLFRAYVTDPDGASDISKVYLRGTDDGDATIFEVRADNLNSTPSYSIQTGADILDLNVSACNWIEDGDYGWAYFYVEFEWDCPSYDDCGIFLYVEDSSGGYHGWYQVRVNFFGLISRVLAVNPRFPDSRVDIGASASLIGSLAYAISSTSNSAINVRPPPSEVNYIHIHNSSHHSVANTSAMLETGLFQVTFNIPDSVQLNTYHIYLDIADDYTDADTPDGNTATVIGDRFAVTSFSSSDVSVPINTNVELRALVESEYDAHSLGTGDYLIIEGVNFTYDAPDSRWEAIVTSATAQTYTYDVLTYIGENTYGIESGTMNGTSVTVTWYSSPAGSGGSGGGSSGVAPLEPPSEPPIIISPSWWQRNGAFVIAALLIGSVFYGQMRKPSEQEAKKDILSSITFNPNDVKDSLVDFGTRVKRDVWDT